MAGVLQQIRGSRRKPTVDVISSAKNDQKALELQAAMEILAEVFGIGISEIEEMLRERLEDGTAAKASFPHRKQGQPLLKHRCDDSAEWPIEFCLAE